MRAGIATRGLEPLRLSASVFKTDVSTIPPGGHNPLKKGVGLGCLNPLVAKVLWHLSISLLSHKEDSHLIDGKATHRGFEPLISS